jgi:hypothetical protein
MRKRHTRRPRRRAPISSHNELVNLSGARVERSETSWAVPRGTAPSRVFATSPPRGGIAPQVAGVPFAPFSARHGCSRQHWNGAQDRVIAVKVPDGFRCAQPILRLLARRKRKIHGCIAGPDRGNQSLAIPPGWSVRRGVGIRRMRFSAISPWCVRTCGSPPCPCRR